LQAPIVEQAWAGHDLALDDATWVIEQIAHWALRAAI
jgi:hypothetical protein